MKQRIALVGTGYWGPNIAHSLEATGEAELAWLCDLNPENLARASRNSPGARTTTNIDDILNDSSVKAVAISTPTATHHPIARKALEAGKHVLVEKPLCSTSAQVEDLIKLAEENKLILMVGHVFMYHAGLRKLKELLDSGEIGDVYYLSLERTNLGPVRTDVNALWDLASHDISIICELLDDPPNSVSATGQHFLNQTVEDVVFATFSYADGRRAHVHASWLNPRKVRHLTVVGSKKMIIWDDMDERAQLQIIDKKVIHPEPGTFVEHKTVCVDGGTVIPPLSVPPPLQEECAHFLECIKTGARPRSDGYNALTVIRLLEAATESMRGNGITVPCNGLG